MEFHRQKKPDYPRIVQIREVGRLVNHSILLVVVALILLVVLALIVVPSIGDYFLVSPVGVFAWYAPYVLIFLLLWTFSKLVWLIANWKGVVVDLQNGILSFPGGGVILKHMTDIFKPRYMFQRYLRFELPLKQIRMVEPQQRAPIDPKDRYYEDWGAELGASIRAAILNRGHKMSWLELNGEFGAIKIYLTPQRRDELYSLIRSYVEMGIPVSEA